MSATTTPLLLLLLLLLSAKLTQVFGESLEAQESARYYEKDFERGGYGGGGYGGGGGYCCQQGGYPSLLELLVPLLLLGILFYLIMNNNNSSSGTGRRKRELPKEERDDLVNWDEIIEASGSYVRSGARSPCYEFYVCAINRQSRKLAAGPALFLRESSVALSGLIMNNNMENITSAAARGFHGVDCSSIYPECTAFNAVL